MKQILTVLTVDSPMRLNVSQLDPPTSRSSCYEWKTAKGSIHFFPTTSTRRKKITKPIAVKIQALQEVERGALGQSDIARLFNIPTSTLSTWIKYADKIKKLYQMQKNEQKVKRARCPEVESKLVEWLFKTRESGEPISRLIIRKKAQQIAQEMKCSEFTGSEGWFEKFKKRHGIVFVYGNGQNNDSGKTKRVRQIGSTYHDQETCLDDPAADTSDVIYEELDDSLHALETGDGGDIGTKTLNEVGSILASISEYHNRPEFQKSVCVKRESADVCD